MFLGWKSSDEYPGHFCEKCGKKYKLKSSLVNHVKYSCAKKPSFFCLHCNLGYYYKQSLQRHTMLTHSNT